MAGRLLLDQGHKVVLHARNQNRANELRGKVAGAEAISVGDLSSIAQTKSVAEQVNELGIMDAVIHNAAVGYQESKRVETEDGLPQVFAVNTLAPYILTVLIRKPKRLVYLSSGLHKQGDASLHDVLLAFAVARLWPDVFSNALDPGWVATKMGGPGASDDLDQGHRTQVWLAVSDDPAAKVTGQYFYHLKRRAAHPAAHDPKIQDKLLTACKEMSGLELS
jgi:NAD(P)-dependent dehydrogenase (short-subunit alcohol dehydrogenase family)